MKEDKGLGEHVPRGALGRASFLSASNVAHRLTDVVLALRGDLTPYSSGNITNTCSDNFKR